MKNYNNCPVTTKSKNKDVSYFNLSKPWRKLWLQSKRILCSFQFPVSDIWDKDIAERAKRTMLEIVLVGLFDAINIEKDKMESVLKIWEIAVKQGMQNEISSWMFSEPIVGLETCASVKHNLFVTSWLCNHGLECGPDLPVML